MNVIPIDCGGTGRRLDLPLYTEAVSAGFPSPAEGLVEHTLDLNQLCVKHPAATFFVRVQGDSMIGAGIHPGDVLVVDRAIAPGHGDIVVACLDTGFTVKELALRPTPRLLPCNGRYRPIAIPDDGSLEIVGVVTGVVRNLRKKP